MTAASEPLPGEGERFTVDLDPVETRGPYSLAPTDYFAMRAMNWSRLKVLAIDSPLHFRHAIDTEPHESKYLTLGSATHCAILEPDEFPRRYVVIDEAECDEIAPGRGTIEGKRLIKEHPEFAPALMNSDAYRAACFALAHPGKVGLSETDYERCLRMRDAVRGNLVAGPYLRRGAREQVVTWTDDFNIPCKARLDWLPADLDAIVELKTDGRTTETLQFSARAWRLGYFGQAVYQRRGMLAVTKRELPRITIAVESNPPHDVTVFDRIDDDSLYAAEQLVFGAEHGANGALERFAMCNRRGRWPGRYAGPEVLKAPRYVFASEDEED